MTDTFAKLQAEGIWYLTADIPMQPTLALRAGGQKLLGRHPFHEAASLGGAESLRGLLRQRYLGDASAYGNAELRLLLVRRDHALAPRFGVFGLADLGRVFLEGESSELWHTAVGGGALPRSCACRILGKCLGGHGDQPGLREQLRKTLEDLEPPDLVFGAHNHIYARSHPLDPAGKPVTTGKGGVRHFVTGGGGAPLYALEGEDPRFPRALKMYHFVYLRLTATTAFYWAIDAGGCVRDSGCFEKGSNVDRPLSSNFSYDDALPPRCTAEGT